MATAWAILNRASNAGVAQRQVHLTRKEESAGSNPVASSSERLGFESRRMIGVGTPLLAKAASPEDD